MKNKINKFFTILSGRPKEGEISECIKPLIFYPQIAFCVWIMYIGFTSELKFVKFLFAFTAIALAWQAGWGMSIERFCKYETKEINKNNSK